jgi:hypothetical protein
MRTHLSADAIEAIKYNIELVDPWDVSEVFTMDPEGDRVVWIDSDCAMETNDCDYPLVDTDGIDYYSVDCERVDAAIKDAEKLPVQERLGFHKCLAMIGIAIAEHDELFIGVKADWPSGKIVPKSKEK